MPFISVSKENLEAAADMLDREQKGELMEMIIDAVLNDGYPSSEDRYVNGVFKQFMSVIERKAKGYAKRVEPLERVNEERKKQPEEQQASAFTEPIITQSVDEYDPTFDNCIQTLQMVRAEKGDYMMEYEADRLSREFGFSTKDLCIAVRGY